MSKEVIKWSKEWSILIEVILIILIESYSISMLSLWFHLYCLVDLLVFFTSSEIRSHWYFKLFTGYLHVRSDCCIEGFFYIAYGKVLRLLLSFGAISKAKI